MHGARPARAPAYPCTPSAHNQPRSIVKPGSRKRKVVPQLPAVNDMSQLPVQMLLGSDFTAPRVKRAG